MLVKLLDKPLYELQYNAQNTIIIIIASESLCLMFPNVVKLFKLSCATFFFSREPTH